MNKLIEIPKQVEERFREEAISELMNKNAYAVVRSYKEKLYLTTEKYKYEQAELVESFSNKLKQKEDSYNFMADANFKQDAKIKELERIIQNLNAPKK